MACAADSTLIAVPLTGNGYLPALRGMSQNEALTLLCRRRGRGVGLWRTDAGGCAGRHRGDLRCAACP